MKCHWWVLNSAQVDVLTAAGGLPTDVERQYRPLLWLRHHEKLSPNQHLGGGKTHLDVAFFVFFLFEFSGPSFFWGTTQRSLKIVAMHKLLVWNVWQC